MSNLQKFNLFWFTVILVIILVLILCYESYGQEPNITIRDFSGGLNTNSNIFGIKPNQCPKALNIDFSDDKPGIRRRKGYVAMTDTLSDGLQDHNYTLFGLYGNKSRSGVNNLFSIVPYTDSTSTEMKGLGVLTMSSDFDYDVDYKNFRSYQAGAQDYINWAHFNGSDTIYDTFMVDLVLGPGDPVADSFYWEYESDTGTYYDSAGISQDSNLLANDFYVKFHDTTGHATDADWLMFSQPGGDSIYPYIYTGTSPYWTTGKGDVYFSNGRQRPIIVKMDDDNIYARTLIPPAPGEPFICPINDSGNYLDGEYRYLIQSSTDCGVGDSIIALADGGLETWSDTSTLNNWDFEDTASLYVLGRDSVEEYTGTWCAHLYSTSNKPNMTPDVSLADTVDGLSPGTNYTLSLYAKTDVSSANRVGVRVISLDDTTQLTLEWVTPTTSWANYSYNFLTTENTDSSSIAILCDGHVIGDTVSIYIDSILLLSEADVLYDSYLSQPVKAYNEKIMLTNFTFHGTTVNCDTDDGNWDDLNLSIYRTKTYPEKINEFDSFYLVANYLGLTAENLDSLRIIDSLPDDTFSVWAGSDIKIYDDTARGRNTDLTYSGFRVGAPTYISRNDSGNTIGCFISLPTLDSASGDSIFIDTTLHGIVYMMTYLDTIIGVESDSGRNLFIACTDSSGDSNFTIGIPPLPSGVDHLVRKLYKTIRYKYPADTSWGNIVLRYDTLEVKTFVGETWPTPFGGNWWIPGGREMYEASDRQSSSSRWVHGSKVFTYYAVNDVEVPIYSLDTTLMPFYPVAVIRDSSVKQVLDTTDWSLISQQTPYARTIAPVNLNQIIYFGDRAWGVDGPFVYFSYLDSGGYWSPFGNIALNLDDGDDITKVYADRDYVGIMKNKSKYVIYDDANGSYSKKWVDNNIGCIAPRSFLKYNNGKIYLSEHGVINETGKFYRDKGSQYGIISLPIENLLDYTPDEHATAVGAIKDNKYWLSYPAKDTTYVYDFLTQGWSIYNYAFSQVTFYDTTKTAESRPAKDMLFIKDDDDRIFKADTTSTDNGTRFEASWKSAPIALSHRLAGLSKIGLYVEPENLDTAMGFRVHDDNDSGYVLQKAVTPTKVYHLFGVKEAELGHWFQLEFYQPGGASTLRLPDINGIDIWLQDGGEPDTH